MDAPEEIQQGVVTPHVTPPAAQQQSVTGPLPGYGGAEGVRVMLGPNIEILGDNPRPDLATFGTIAFEAQDKQSGAKLVVKLCEKKICPRLSSIASYKNAKSSSLQKLMEYGVIQWPPLGRQMVAMAFEMPMGRRIMSVGDSAPAHIALDNIVHSILRPVLHALEELKKVEVVHGAIRPENIFIQGADGGEMAMLGECLSSMPSYGQDALCAPIDRAMAHPAGRGLGSVKTDLYSLGMCIVTLIRGENFAARMTQEQIIREKLENGSNSFAGRERLPGGLGEFLRGVLVDDEEYRWGMEEAMAWLEGTTGGAKKSSMTSQAARPFVFYGIKHWDTRSLAMTFAMHPGEAATEMDNNQFDLWAKRNFEDAKMHERIDVTKAGEDSANIEKRVANICLALDPQGPVRYKGLSILPQGFGGMLAHGMAKGDDAQVYAEILMQNFFSTWIHQLEGQGANAGPTMLLSFDKARSYVTQRMMGYGIERVLYFLNRDAPCMSSVLTKSYVTNPGQLLLALESVSQSNTRPESIFDRHMVAFLSVRDPKIIDPNMSKIISRSTADNLVGVVRTLEAIQRRYATGPVPGVGNWIVSMLQPALERYNDRDLRQELTKRVEKLSDPGSLTAILALVDSAEIVQEDSRRFKVAQQEFAQITQEGRKLLDALKRRSSFGMGTGRDVAMLFSAALAVTCILGFIAIHFTGGGF